MERRFCQLCGKKEYQDECSYGPHNWEKFTIKRIPMGGSAAKPGKDDNYVKPMGDVDEGVGLATARALDATKPPLGRDSFRRRVSQALKMREVDKETKKNKERSFTNKKASQTTAKEELVVDEAFERINRAGKTYMVLFQFRGQYKSMQFFFPTAKRPTREQVNIQLQRAYPNAVLTNFLEKDRQPGEPLIYVEGAQTWGEFTEARNPYAVGMAAAKKKYGDEPPLEKRTIKKAHDIADAIKKEATEFVGAEFEGRGTPKNTEHKIDGSNLKKKSRDAVNRLDADVDGDVDSKDPSQQETGAYGEKIPDGDGSFETKIKEDWQKVNRKDKTDGLSQKAVDAYRRENPGSKLKTAVTEKNPKGKRKSRRASFCARMGGMKKRLTSAKTARDPDSNINKALRRWNCN